MLNEGEDEVRRRIDNRQASRSNQFWDRDRDEDEDEDEDDNYDDEDDEDDDCEDEDEEDDDDDSGREICDEIAVESVSTLDISII